MPVRFKMAAECAVGRNKFESDRITTGLQSSQANERMANSRSTTNRRIAAIQAEAKRLNVANEENKRAMPKAGLPPRGPSNMASDSINAKVQPAAQAASRRALGDIGNLVGSLSKRCSVTKDGLLAELCVLRHEPSNVSPNVAPKFAPRSRRLEQNFERKVSVSSQRIATLSRRTAKAPQETRSRPVESRLAPLSSADAYEELSTRGTVPPSGQKQLGTYDARAKAVKRRQTLTAILTARSQAASVGCEIEMEDALDVLPNIDGLDIGNQLAVVDYVEDIYSFYRRTEIQSIPPPDYMRRQPDINEKMRAILIDWLIEVHWKFQCMPETLFLTTNLIDRFLSRQRVLRKYLQLVGVTAMLVACKYEEIWSPEVKDFVTISDEAYTREQVLNMERMMLNNLEFNLTVPTPYMFLVRFLKAAASDIQMEMLAFFFVELCLTEYIMVQYCPSLMAAAAVYTARRTLRVAPFWSALLQRHTGYTEMQLSECAYLMTLFHRQAGHGSTTSSVYRKYSHETYHAVATTEPATFVPANIVGKAAKT